MLAASSEPESPPPPAPMSVWISSMKSMTSGSEAASSRTFLILSSKSPLYLEPATSEPMSMLNTVLPLMMSGTSPCAIASASPSAMAVARICMTRLISCSRPITGSILPSPAMAVRFLPNFSSVLRPPLPDFFPEGPLPLSLLGAPGPNLPMFSSAENSPSSDPSRAPTSERRPDISSMMPLTSAPALISTWLPVSALLVAITKSRCSGFTIPSSPILLDTSMESLRSLLDSRRSALKPSSTSYFPMSSSITDSSNPRREARDSSVTPLRSRTSVYVPSSAQIPASIYSVETMRFPDESANLLA